MASKPKKCDVNFATSNEAGGVHVANCDDDNRESKVTRKVPADYRSPSPTFLLSLGLENVSVCEATAMNASVSGTPGSTAKQLAGDHDVSSKETLVIVPKKRPFSCKPSKTISTKKKRVSKPRNRVEKRAHETAMNESYSNITEVSAKKSRELEPPATDRGVKGTPKEKKKHGNKKRQQMKPTSSKSTTVSSTALELTSITGKVPSESDPEMSDRRFWNGALANDFKSSKFRELLKMSEFSEIQATVIQKSLEKVCQKSCDYSISIFDERPMKKHKCVECDFSISHECASAYPTEYFPMDDQQPVYITPDSPTMCVCNFAINHSHASHIKSKSKHQDHEPIDSPLSMLENSRTVTLCCPKCQMNVLIQNRQKYICSDLMNWVSHDGPHRKKFYKYVKEHIVAKPKQTLKLSSEFFSCHYLCCMMFHRCSEDIIPNTVPIQFRSAHQVRD